MIADCFTDSRIYNVFYFQISQGKGTVALTSVYKELTGIVFIDDKEESPYICSTCQTTLKFSFNLRRGIRDSDIYLSKIRDKIKNFERVIQSGKPGDNQLHQLKAKIFSNGYCRLCFSETGDFVNVFDRTNVNHGRSYVDIYKIISKKPLIPNELSQVICIKCKDHLIRYNEARHKARENDEYVKKLLQDAGNSVNGNQPVPAAATPKAQTSSSKIQSITIKLSNNNHKTQVHQPIAPEFIKMEPEPEFQEVESTNVPIVDDDFPMPVEIKDEPSDVKMEES